MLSFAFPCFLGLGHRQNDWYYTEYFHLGSKLDAASHIVSKSFHAKKAGKELKFDILFDHLPGLAALELLWTCLYIVVWAVVYAISCVCVLWYIVRLSLLN